MSRALLATWVRHLGALAALVGLLLGAAPARAFSITGEVGLAGSRSDGWTDGQHAGIWGLDWSAQLSLAGSPFRPGLLDWNLVAYYRGVRNYYFDSSDSTDGIGGRLQISALQGAPVSFSLFGARDWNWFATSADNRTGATLSTSAGATALFNMPHYPTVRASFLWTELDNHSLDGQEAKSDNYGLDIGVAHSIGGLTYALTYDTAWNTGTFADTNYRFHSLNLQLSANISDTAIFRLVGRYFLRDPSNDNPSNPRFDDGSIGVGVQWQPDPRTTAAFDYLYHHFVVQSTNSPTVDQTNHVLTHSTTWRRSAELSITANATVDYTRELKGDDGLQSASESVGLSFAWQRRRANLAGGIGLGGQVGVIESNISGVSPAYGATLSAGITTDRRSFRLSLAYSGGVQVGLYGGPTEAIGPQVTVTDVQSGLVGAPGWTLNQQLTLTGEGVVHNAFMGRATLAFVGARRDDPLLGTSVDGTASLILEAYTARHRVQLAAGATEGAAAPLKNGFTGDGLFVPVGYDSYSLFATLSGGQMFSRGTLVLTESLRALWTHAPAQPDQYEYGAYLSLGYSLGAFIFNIDERFSIGGLVGTQQIGNLLMARMSRSLGWRF